MNDAIEAFEVRMLRVVRRRQRANEHLTVSWCAGDFGEPVDDRTGCRPASVRASPSGAARRSARSAVHDAHPLRPSPPLARRGCSVQAVVRSVDPASTRTGQLVPGRPRSLSARAARSPEPFPAEPTACGALFGTVMSSILAFLRLAFRSSLSIALRVCMHRALCSTHCAPRKKSFVA
jgi:hypothetical protein